MTGAVAIAATQLGKSFPRGVGAFSIFCSTMLGRRRPGFWAVRDATFEIAAGSAVGIIGRNGSGKSTLLQLLCGTLQPTTGSARVFGRVAAMLELGAGFNGDFTGRENVYLAAGVYGLSNAQIEQRFDDIERFADIGPYIDRPVSEYSSGMYARLAFAVCAHVDADVLIVDEILGVGDASFQRKCQRFMHEFRRRGTLVFVSHDPGAVLATCDDAIWLDQGRIVMFGDAQTVLDRYAESDTALSLASADSILDQSVPDFADLRLADRNMIAVSPFNNDCASHGSGGARIVDSYFTDASGNRQSLIRGGQEVTLHLLAEVREDLQSPIMGFMFRNEQGQNLFGDNTFLSYRRSPPNAAAGSMLEAQLEFRMPYLPRGRYCLAPSIIAGTQQSHEHVCWLEDALLLSVDGEAVRHGKVGLTIDGFSITARSPLEGTASQAAE